MIVLVVKPVGYSSRGQQFDGSVGDRILVCRSSTPLCDAARRLLAEGADASTVIVMRHFGRSVDALRSTIGAAAKLSIEEGDRPPAFRRWKDRPFAAGEPPSDFSEMPATTPPEAA